MAHRNRDKDSGTPKCKENYVNCTEKAHKEKNKQKYIYNYMKEKIK